MSERAPHVELSDVHLSFGNRAVLRGLSCHFPPNQISVILGGSGTGKSTLLRLIGGLVQPDSGRVMVDGEDITSLNDAQLNTVRSKLGMLFQGGALLDALTVFDNVAFPLREHTTMTETRIRTVVHQRLEAVGLTGVDELLPGELSGGMLKRVALARAIIMKPRIVLCDEPFSGLDPISSRRIEGLLMQINQELGMTVIMVSHGIASTMRMADHLLVLLPEGAAEGTIETLRENHDPRLAAFLTDDVDDSLDDVEVAGAR